MHKGKGLKVIHRNEITKKVHKNELQSYLDDGWKLGHSELLRRKVSAANIGRVLSSKTRKRMSEAKIGGTVGFTGRKHSDSSKKKMSESGKGKVLSTETRRKLSEAQKGRKLSEETKQKMRLSAISRIEKNNGICIPSYNIVACEFFKIFDEENKTQGRYAVYGGGEYYIKELGYFPDYINFNLKLIIEWDEEKHFKNGILNEKDIQRQKEIQQLFPDFEFKRIREKP